MNFALTSGFMISVRMMLTASSENRRNGSDTATGETPLLAGKPISSMVRTGVGPSYCRCSVGLNRLPTASELLSVARYLAKDRLRLAWVSLEDGCTLGGLETVGVKGFE